MNPFDAPSTHYSQKSGNNNNNINNYNPGMSVPFGSEEIMGGESVKVALRVRPMNNLERSRGDNYCVKSTGDNSIQINLK